MKRVRSKIEQWVDENPDGYLQKNLAEIAHEVGVATGSLDRHLYNIIADRDGCLPSEVIAKRAEAGFKRNPTKFSAEEHQKIIDLHNEDMEVCDIAYLTGKSRITVQKHINEHLRNKNE